MNLSQGGSLFDSPTSYLPWTKSGIQDILFHLMIEFSGTTEESWMKMPSHRVKQIWEKLKKWKKDNKKQACPFLS